MSQEVWGWIAISAMQLLTALISMRTTMIVSAQSKTIGALEKNTNSIREQLVASTAKASQAAGELKGRADQKAENAIVRPPVTR
jgi:hypothetical protein